MGLFADIILDARRPLNGHWIRRTMAEEADSGLPEEDSSPENTTGMNTIFRFQKAESPALPGGFLKASIQPGAVQPRIPVGDPLSVGMEVERQKSITKSVGITDISVTGDSRESELETGQEERISPSKVKTANMSSESQKVRSSSAPGQVEAESFHARLESDIPDGSRQLVSQRSETFESRRSGRGAPSETFPSTSEPIEDELSRFPISPAHAEHSHRFNPGTNATPPEWETVHEPGKSATTRDSQNGKASSSTHALIPPMEEKNFPLSRHGHSSFTSASPDASPDVAAETPSLIIGRINVTVIATEPRPLPAPRGDDSRGFLSRNYLKRI